MAQRGIDVKGLREFRTELKRVDAEFPKALRKVHKEIADDVADRAQNVASGMGGVRAKAAGAIRGYATQVQASVGVSGGGIANVAFWGALKRSGWYAHIHSPGGRRQHPMWVGNSWEPGVAGQGPYAINDAIADKLPDIDESYLDAIEDLARSAFPD
jgi:hypothetical protein